MEWVGEEFRFRGETLLPRGAPSVLSTKDDDFARGQLCRDG